MELDVHIRFTEPLLASSAASPDVYKQYIAERKRQEIAHQRTRAIAAATTAEEIEAATADELETLSSKERELSGWSVFHRDESGLFVFDYHARGHLKEAARAITGKGISAIGSKIDRWLFVRPRRIYLHRDGQTLGKPDGVMERPIRAMTMQGPRTSLKRSDFVAAGTEAEFSLLVLPLGEKELTPERIRAWLDYGQYMGWGEWRTGSHGRFEIVKLCDGKVR